MAYKIISAVVLAGFIALPAIAHAEEGGAAAGAATGAVGGAIVGGPVGAAVGGVTGAIVGGVLSGPDQTRVRQYVVRERHPSVRVQEDVEVGAELPGTVRYYEIPADVGVNTTYRYTVVNDRAVLVDPRTRRVVQILE
jgi:phage tail tape-measure protein